MSSPSPSATSPTDRSFSLPQKRQSFSSFPSGGAPKRRKASFASASSHPLRQTSFPPPGATSPQPAPSRHSSFSPSVSSFGGRGGSGRKRKQHARASSTAAESASKGGAGPAGSAKEGDGKGGDRDDEDAEDDDDMDADDTMLEPGLGGGGTKEENENLALLMDAFNPDQEERYAAYRRVKLKKEVVRRIVNQTLSQSVPQSIVTTINGYTKVFIGDLVERARDVQTQWQIAKQQAEAAQRATTTATSQSDEKTASASADAKMPSAKDSTTEQGDPRQSVLEVKEYDRGPLTPDHLREALRRYKKDGEGGNSGFQGLSLHGVEAAASRSGGRRLFR